MPLHLFRSLSLSSTLYCRRIPFFLSYTRSLSHSFIHSSFIHSFIHSSFTHSLAYLSSSSSPPLPPRTSLSHSHRLLPPPRHKPAASRARSLLILRSSWPPCSSLGKAIAFLVCPDLHSTCRLRKPSFQPSSIRLSQHPHCSVLHLAAPKDRKQAQRRFWNQHYRHTTANKLSKEDSCPPRLLALMRLACMAINCRNPKDLRLLNNLTPTPLPPLASSRLI
ncbi:hypothetical protein B0O80DRAFT_48495 [Mortierella sp. GBAus27b]|nr:hypothetical protein B0O80DRAFT_48495 [Mortierella sp. GBAus27b]